MRANMPINIRTHLLRDVKDQCKQKAIKSPLFVIKQPLTLKHLYKVINRKVKRVFRLHKKGNYLDLSSFSRQASLTHALKLPFPALDSICASKSSSKRMIFIVLFDRLNDFFSFFACIGKYRYDKLYFKGIYHYICEYLKKAMPRSAGTLSRHLTQPLTGVMIMANRYDSAHLRAEQIKRYKFYDISTSTIYQIIASTEHQAREKLGNQPLIFMARLSIQSTHEQSITCGGYAHV